MANFDAGNIRDCIQRTRLPVESQSQIPGRGFPCAKSGLGTIATTRSVEITTRGSSLMRAIRVCRAIGTCYSVTDSVRAMRKPTASLYAVLAG